jgi:hypothetical protein
MKSIKQQYIDLREGNMSQANFMRNLRMSLPQYVTNLSSFEDSIKILKNKGILTEADMNVNMSIPTEQDIETALRNMFDDGLIDNIAWKTSSKALDNFDIEGNMNMAGSTTAEDLAKELVFIATGEDVQEPGDDYDMDYEEPDEPFDMAESLNEAKDEKGKWTNADGKSMYAHFQEINKLNAQEVLIGIDYEMQKNEELTKAEAQKIVIKNLKKNPIYYTAEDMSGVEGYEPEYMGGKSAQPEARQMQYLDKNMGNVVDKKMGMQPVKGIEKAKKDSDKGGETNKAVKNIELMSLIAKTVRGMKKMDATGEKMKKIAIKEARMNDFPGETPGKIAQQIATYVDSNPTLKKYSDEITLQSNPDGFLKFGYWDELPSDAIRALSLQFDIKEDSDYDEDTGTLIFYRLTPKHTPGKINLSKADLMNMIREELEEALGAYNSGDNVTDVTGENY